MNINPKKVRYIKLGVAGEWEKSCIENNNVVRIGFESPYHNESKLGQWDIVKQYWLKERKGNSGVATRDVNQIRDFYELSENDIWITFYKREMWWCRASRDIIELEDQTKIRKVIGKWSNKNLKGHRLSIEKIDGRVTKVQGFRGTICSFNKQKNYLIDKINGVTSPEVVKAKENKKVLIDSINTLIQGLWWPDFELLIDLIFSSAGWQRISVAGKTEKDIDLDLFSPISQKKVFVQIKSKSDIKQFEEYINTFNSYKQYDEMYYVVHTSKDNLKGLVEGNDKIHLMDLNRIAELVVNAGLLNWLIEKRS
jgi:hypothetical protein